VALGQCCGSPLAQEAFNDAIYFKDEALRAFKLGILSLEERAQVRAHRLYLLSRGPPIFTTIIAP
jgi:arginine decarboxylase-like protein